MGKKKFNARQKSHVEYVINNSDTKKIVVESEKNEYSTSYDNCNAIALPSKKRETRAKVTTKRVTRILSKKQRKRLEQIVDKKSKKENRSLLLENLASVQLPAADLKQFTSITQFQTKGLKKHYRELEQGTNKRLHPNESKEGEEPVAESSNKRLRTLSDQIEDESDDEEDRQERNYNHIGVDESSSEDSGDEIHIENNTESGPNIPVVENTRPEELTKIKRSESILNAKAAVEPVVDSSPAVYIHVNRTPAIQQARLKLPILGEEQVIMEAIKENPIVIIAGETGSGKTTQVPQFLYEAGFAENQLIGVTEPRRVAAISMANRVGEEMNLGSNMVSYLIRFEGNVTDKTKIKFMTDGVLLKEIENDFLLTKYSVIILDEAHERSVYTDILIGLLSRIVPLRNKRGSPLKLIIMSATLRVSDFTENKRLFKITPPVVSVDSRQFPVTEHFSKRTDPDYVGRAYRKAIDIHKKLPDGGILIFVTGQQEVHRLVKRLRKAFPILINKSVNDEDNANQGTANDVNTEDLSDDEFDIKKAIKRSKKSRKQLATQLSLPKVNLDHYKLPGDDTEADLLDDDKDILDDSEFGSSEDDDSDEELRVGLNEAPNVAQPLWVLPLYSLLSSESQARVFKPSPEGARLCVISTNVAETSLTIPNIKYVIDCGRQKTRLYDKVTGVSAYHVTYTSKASANQRKGRAGRMGPGHCYRLYSSAVYNDEFKEFSEPEIQRKPVDDLMLQMKCMGIDRVVNFPFPSPPDLTQLAVAERKLKLLGALEDDKDLAGVTKVTKLGKAISVFPVAPRFGKMLALSHQHNLMAYTICMVAALSVPELLQEVALNDASMGENSQSKLLQKRLSWAGSGNSLSLGDPMVLMRAVGASEFAHSKGTLTSFCNEQGLRHKAVVEIRKLRVQLTNEINLHIPDLELFVDPEMKPPTDDQIKFLRQILLAGLNDQVARKVRLPDQEGEANKVPKFGYKTAEMEDHLFIHSASVLRKTQPEWIVYQEAYEVEFGEQTKMIMRGITAIEPEWIVNFAPGMCNFEPIPDTKPYYDSTTDRILHKVHATFGRYGWELPDAEIEMEYGAEACKYFGLFLLSGDVYPKLAEYQTKLLSTPMSIIKMYNKLIPRVERFIKALLRHQINSRKKLEAVWKSDPKYLLAEYQDWLPDSLKAEVMMKWPSMFNS